MTPIQYTPHTPDRFVRSGVSPLQKGGSPIKYTVLLKLNLSYGKIAYLCNGEIDLERYDFGFSDE